MIGKNIDRIVRLDGRISTDIIDGLDCVVFVVDIDSSEILYANGYLKSLLGFDPTGRMCSQFMHEPDCSSCVLCDLGGELLDKGGKPLAEIQREYINPFDKKWYAARDRVIRWSDDRLVRLEVATDISEQKRLQNFLQEARQQAENTITTKNKFVALVAHDLKSPFVSILGMLKRILERETFSHEVHRQFLETIITNGRRMLNMIDNLLTMERLETGGIKPEPCFFNLSQMVEEVFANFDHQAHKKNLNLENLVKPDKQIYADRYLYLVVVNNLVSNAVKFSHEEGSITVSLKHVEGEDFLVVRDYGQGIPASCSDDIFRPDVKTTRPGTCGEPGSGLGLVFSQQIMHAHGGEIEFDSKEGGGSVFRVRLRSCPLKASGEDKRV
jgi:signal transduction histidine kinase